MPSTLDFGQQADYDNRNRLVEDLKRWFRGVTQSIPNPADSLAGKFGTPSLPPERIEATKAEFDPASVLGPVGLIKGGRIAPELVPKPVGGTMRAFQGSAEGLGTPLALKLEGKDITEVPAVWNNALQTFYPKNSPQEIKVYNFKDRVPPEFGATGHFGHAHARKVQTNKPLDFWEEIQSEFKFDKPPSKNKTTTPLDEYGIPQAFASPWATENKISLGTVRTPERNYVESRMEDSYIHGYNRTVRESASRFIRPEHHTNIDSQLSQETHQKLNEMPAWVKSYVDGYKETWEHGGPSTRIRPVRAHARDFIEKYEADTSIPEDKKKILYSVIDPISTTSFQFQPAEHALTEEELAQHVTPAGRISNFVDQIHDVYAKLTKGVTPVKAPAERFPAYGRERQAEFIIDRLISEADRNKRVFTMADAPGALMRSGKPLSYGYKEAPKKMGLVPEMLRLTTPNPSISGYSFGPRELNQMLASAGSVNPNDMSPIVEDILRAGGSVKNVTQPTKISSPINSVYSYNIPVWTRPKDIDLAKSLGMYQKGNPRPDLYEDIRRYNELNTQLEPIHIKQLLDRIFNMGGNPLEHAFDMDVNLRGLVRRVGGARRDFSNEEVQTLVRQLAGGNIPQVSNYAIPLDVQARLLTQYDPLEAFAALLEHRR
jgi:hypothetical protein